MKLTIFPHAAGYSLELTGHETARWCDRAGHTWPGSALDGRPLSIEVDREGICWCDVTDWRAAQLAAIVRDHQPDVVAEFWPRLETKAHRSPPGGRVTHLAGRWCPATLETGP